MLPKNISKTTTRRMIRQTKNPFIRELQQRRQYYIDWVQQVLNWEYFEWIINQFGLFLSFVRYKELRRFTSKGVIRRRPITPNSIRKIIQIILSFFRVPGQAKVQIPKVLLFVCATTIGPYQRGAGLVYFLIQRNSRKSSPSL